MTVGTDMGTTLNTNSATAVAAVPQTIPLSHQLLDSTGIKKASPQIPPQVTCL